MGLGWLCITTKAREQGEQRGCEVDFVVNLFAHQHLCDRLSMHVAVLVTVGHPVRAHMGRGLC